MAGNRVVEVLYRLKDLFTGQVSKIVQGYRDLSGASAKTAAAAERDNNRILGSFDRFTAVIARVRSAWLGLSTALGAGVALRSLTQFAEQADKVGKVSATLGVASEELSALGYAAERSNISFDTMATALQRLVRRSAEAANGTGEAREALRTLGIDARAFTQLGLEQKMALLADAMRGIDDQGQRVALAMKLFDTEGVAMVRILQDGSEAMLALTNRARELGAVYDDEATRAAAEFNDTLADLKATASGIGVAVGTPTLKAFNNLAANFGVSADRAANLRAELDYLRDRLNNKLTLSPYDYFVSAQALLGVRDLRAEYDRVAAELAKIEAAQNSKSSADKAAAAASAEVTQAAREQALAYKDAQERASAAVEARKAALKAETEELRKAKAAQLTIEQEFAELVKRVTTQPKEVSLGDVFGANTKARAALAAGEYEKAITLARSGGELLEQLKTKGSETTGTLSFLAQQLQQVATQAAASSASKEGRDVDLAKNAVAAYEAQFEQLTLTAAAAGDAAGLAYANAMAAALARVPLALPPVAAPEREIVRQGNLFSYQAAIAKQGVK